MANVIFQSIYEQDFRDELVFWVNSSCRVKVLATRKFIADVRGNTCSKLEAVRWHRHRIDIISLYTLVTTHYYATVSVSRQTLVHRIRNPHTHTHSVTSIYRCQWPNGTQVVRCERIDDVMRCYRHECDFSSIRIQCVVEWCVIA